MLSLPKPKSVAILYLDVATAFASMIRGVVLPVGDTDLLCKRLQQVGFSVDIVHEISVEMRDCSFWECIGVSQHQLDVLCDAYEDTWMTMELVVLFPCTNGTLTPILCCFKGFGIFALSPDDSAKSTIFCIEALEIYQSICLGFGDLDVV